MNSLVTFCTVLVNVFFRGNSSTITVIVFDHGNGVHGNYRSFTAVKIPRGNPRGKPLKIRISNYRLNEARISEPGYACATTFQMMPIATRQKRGHYLNLFPVH